MSSYYRTIFNVQSEPLIPNAISSVTAYDDVTTIDAGDTTTLTANGVQGTDAVVTWWTGSGGTSTNLGTGTTLVVGVGTYYARVTGYGAPAEAFITIYAATLLGADYPFSSGDNMFFLEKVEPNFTGDLIEIQRHSDDTTQWFQLSGNRLSISELQSFIGSSTAGVKTWNAQYGGLVLSQTDKTKQPYIAVNGNLYYANGRLALYYDTSRTCGMTATGYNFGGGTISAFAVASRWSAGHLFSANRPATSAALEAYQTTPGGARISRYNSASQINGAVASNLQSVLSLIYNGTQFNAWYDTVLQNTTSPASRASFTGGTIKIGQNLSETGAGTFLFQGLAIYKADKTSDRVGIENKLASMYDQNFAFSTVNFLLPDCINTQAGEGFAPTGIFINEEKTLARTDGGIVLLVANAGLNSDTVPWLPAKGTLMELLLPAPATATDLTVATKLQEADLYLDSNFGTNRVIQGMCRANDGTVWMYGGHISGGTNYLLNYTYPVAGASTFIKRYAITTNGLAYDSVNDRLVISSAATPAVVSFVNPATGAVTAAPNNFTTNVDGIFIDSVNQILYGSRGTNVAACPIVSISLDATSIANKAVIVNPNTYNRANAPEGFVLGAPDGRNPILTIICNDAFNHASTPVIYRGINNLMVARYD